MILFKLVAKLFFCSLTLELENVSHWCFCRYACISKFTNIIIMLYFRKLCKLQIKSNLL